MYRIPAKVDYLNETYSLPLDLLLTDRNVISIDENYTFDDNVSFDSVISRFRNAIPFKMSLFNYYVQGSIEDCLSSQLPFFRTFYNECCKDFNVVEFPTGGRFSNCLINNQLFNSSLINEEPGTITTPGSYTAVINLYDLNHESAVYLTVNNYQLFFSGQISAYAERSIDHGVLHGEYKGRSIFFSIQCVVNQTLMTDIRAITFTVRVQEDSAASIIMLNRIINSLDELDDDVIVVDTSNPYDVDGTGSVIGGGDGSYDNPDEIVKVEFPDLPDIDAVTTGLLTIFNPSLSQVNALGNYLWSNAFDVDTLKKLFGDPMDAIIGLSIVPVKPPLAGTKTVKIGNISTDVSMPYCSRQFVEKTIGSIAIKKYVGSFMDYAPYTKIQIYLPYVGVRDLNPDDVMGETITVKYHIDILTGGCAAMISVGSKGVMYQYNGSCIANVPLTAINYSGAIQNAVSAIGSGITAVVGMATGAAPLTGVGIAGLATSAANTALSSKPTIQRSGSMGGSSGLMSVQQCYLIITRPRMSVPTNLNRFGGYPANINAKLSTLTGLTMIDSIRLDNIPAMETEKQELLSLLQKGVIF